MSFEIGQILETQEPFALDIANVITGRTFLASITRWGKSWTARKIIEECFGHAGIIIIDPEGEYCCLTPDTPILLCTGKLVTAQEVYDLVRNGKKVKVVSLVNRRDNIAHKGSFEYYKFVHRSVTAVSKYKVDELVEIRGRMGRVLVGTPNHKVLITRHHPFHPGRRPLLWVPLSEVRVGDRLAIPHQIPNKRIRQRVLPATKLRESCSGLVKEGDTYVWMKGHNSKPRIKVPKLFDEKFAEWMGYFLADGRLSKDLKKVMFIEGNKGRRIRFATLSRELFGVNGNDNDEKCCYTINNKALGVFLKKVVGVQSGRKARNLHIPDIVMTSPLKEKRAFLKAYSLCDGSPKDEYRYAICTTSKFAASQLAYLFETTGVHASIRKTKVSSGFNPSSVAYSVFPVKGRRLSFKRKGCLDTVKVTSVKHLKGEFEVIGTLVPESHNMVVGDTPLVAHNSSEKNIPSL